MRVRHHSWGYHSVPAEWSCMRCKHSASYPHARGMIEHRTDVVTPWGALTPSWTWVHGPLCPRTT
jgi:hypothetical protein